MHTCDEQTQAPKGAALDSFRTSGRVMQSVRNLGANLICCALFSVTGTWVLACSLDVRVPRL
jgi:hypothetical protein